MTCCCASSSNPTQKGTPNDLFVIGGGIVGAGIVREAALRGLNVRLVEKADFASGTSGSSSRLLHGGLRYLGQGKLGLVREASTEKVILGQIAPHLAKPLPFLFPSFKGSSWPRWKLTIGVTVYDLLCSGKNFGRSESLNQSEMLEAAPGLAADELRGGVRYFDGFTRDARLVIDTLRSAAVAGAQIQNYTEVIDSTAAVDYWELRTRCRDCGNESTSNAKAVVNATGPWAQKLEHSDVRLRLTKGVHLVVASSRLPVSAAVVMPEGDRILFAIPWGERTILGTTDTDFAGDPDDVRCTETDRDYVLRIVNRYFPSANLVAADVRSTWAGLRPLIAPRGTTKEGTPSDISRSHKILMPKPGWFDVAGGKLTTYRIIGEQSVDRIIKHLRATGQCPNVKPSQTEHLPLLRDASAGEIVSGVLPPAVTREVVQHFCEHEWTRHLSDVMVQRTSWAYYLDEHRDTSKTVADWMASCLNWDSERTAHEIAAYGAAADSLESFSPEL